MERWIVLLSYWQKIEFRHALTFPFLIGALRNPVGSGSSSSRDAKKELEELLDSMQSHHSEGYFHHVYRCPDLGQLVVRKVVGTSPPRSSVPITRGKKMKQHHFMLLLLILPMTTYQRSVL